MIKGLFEAKRWNALFQVFPEKYIPGFMMTLKVALTGLLLALVLGIIFGMLSTSKAKICRFFSRVYVEFFQNTPLVVQVFFYYNCLPYVIGGRVPKFMLGVLGVGIYHGAYISEVIRTGIEAVPKGQFEAAYSQGFSFFQTLFYIVLPQTYKSIIPAMLSQVITVIKDTSFLKVVDIAEFMRNSYVVMGKLSAPAHIIMLYSFIALCYFIICFSLSCGVRYYQKKVLSAART